MDGTTRLPGEKGRNSILDKGCIKFWGSKIESEDILKIDGKQTKRLEVDKWEVFPREEDTEGTLLVVGLDQPSLDCLTRTQVRAVIVTKAIFFNIGKLPIGTAENNGETTRWR